MVEAHIHLRLLPKSELDTSKVFEPLTCCLRGIWEHPYTNTQTKLAQDFGLLGHLWSKNDAIMSWLRLISTSDCFPHPFKTYKMCLRFFCCLKGIWMHPCIVMPAKVASDFGIWDTCVLKMMPLRDGWGWHPPQTASHILNRHLNVFEVLFCSLKGILVHPYTVTLAKLAPYFGLLGHLRVEMMPLRHGWGWYPPQTGSHIHSSHIQHVWAIGIGMLSHRHMGAPLYHYTGQVGPRFWIGSLVDWKWCHYVMVEADIHLRLLPTSI